MTITMSGTRHRYTRLGDVVKEARKHPNYRGVPCASIRAAYRSTAQALNRPIEHVVALETRDGWHVMPDYTGNSLATARWRNEDRVRFGLPPLRFRATYRCSPYWETVLRTAGIYPQCPICRVPVYGRIRPRGEIAHCAKHQSGISNRKRIHGFDRATAEAAAYANHLLNQSRST